MEELDGLREKVDALIRQYKASQASIKKLTTALAKKDEEIGKLKDTITALNEQSLAHAAGTLLQTPKEREIVRKQLDAVIGEIDKILTAIND